MSVSCKCCVSCQVSVKDRSLVQRSPTECDVSECNREISTMKRHRPTGAIEP